MKKIYFRADGNSTIGLGHVVRSLALAEILKEDFITIFLIQRPSDKLLTEIKEKVKEVVILEYNDNLEKEANALIKLLDENSFVVLDGYHFKTSYQKVFKSSKALKVVCIDDVHDCHYFADAIINHSGSAKETDYDAESYTKLFLGPKYSLLRKPFREATTLERSFEAITNLFICFGGADTTNNTIKVLVAAGDISNLTKITIVIGSAYAYKNELISCIQNIPTQIELLENIGAEEMVKAFQSSHLAICPSSSIAYEACHIGIGLITGYYVDNQRGIASFLEKEGCGVNAGDFNSLTVNDLISIIKHIDVKTVNEQIKAQRQVFNNSQLSLKSIFSELCCPEIEIRRATLSDLMTYYNWANDEEVRANSINRNSISLESHTKWFEVKLTDPDTYFFFFSDKKASAPVGQVRIDFKEQEGLISYSIAKEYRGKGLGKILIDKAITTLKKYRDSFKLKAYVKYSNPASLKVFSKVNFSESENEIIKEEVYSVFTFTYTKTL